MSNLSDKEEHELNSASQPAVKSEYRLQRWSALQGELNEAVKLWQTLEAQIKPMSPEEKQLQELKALIAQVKAKLEQF